MNSCTDDDGGSNPPDVPNPPPPVETPTTSVYFHPNTNTSAPWILTGAGDSPVEGTADNFGLRYEVPGVEGEATITIATADGVSREYTITLGAESWLYEATSKVYTEAPPIVPGADEMAVYYQADDGMYEGWGLHLWDFAGQDWTTWQEPLAFTSITEGDYGAGVLVPLPASPIFSAAPTDYESFPETLGLIIHKGDDKSTGADLSLNINRFGNMVFFKKGSSEVFCSPDYQLCPRKPEISGAAAHWVDTSEIRWQVPAVEDLTYELRYSLAADIRLDDQSGQVVGGESIALTLTPGSENAAFPHLNEFTKFSIATDDLDLATILKSQLVAVATGSNGQLVSATQVQIPGVIDALYANDEALGLIIDGANSKINAWAPTARTMTLKVFETPSAEPQLLPMTAGDKGIWTAAVNPEWITKRYYYTFAIEVYHPKSDKVESYDVIDPYSLNMNTNSRLSQFINLDDADLKPAGWDALVKAPIAPSDISIYEVHVRDFSILDPTAGVHKGKYSAFALLDAAGEPTTTALTHLKGLKEAGLTHVQVLPSNDFATIEENVDDQVNLLDSFNRLCEKVAAVPRTLCETYKDQIILDVYLGAEKSSPLIQEINQYLRPVDGFNWGYDPLIFGAPEGSYASNPENESRILEFRTMVKGLADLGLRFSLDVVYNHTYASGIGAKSILDRMVPGYYHRQNSVTGAVETSTCCDNTASEHAMMEKLMIDTHLRWRDDYKVDAFRYDLMGHHMKRNMEKLKVALGDDIFMYGEGWNFGEVENGQRGENATQINMAGTGIATFNDRFRDAIRGGGPFDCGYLLTNQGLVNGLFVNNNSFGGLLEPAKDGAQCTALTDYQPAPAENTKALALELSDRVRIGLAGSLATYSFTNSSDQLVTGLDISYGGSPAGYTSQPYETINYISKHDNQTLWDINQLKLPIDSPMADRVGVQKLGLAMNSLAQGVPFYHMGVEILRSKSLNRDSFDSGDWYNQVDFTLETHVWNRGLPREDKDGDNWPLFTTILEAVPNAPSKTDMESTRDYFEKLLRLRYSSPLFRLQTAADVSQRLKFLNTGSSQTPGVVMMSLNDSCELGSLDAAVDEILIIFNVNPKAMTLDLPKAYSQNPEFPAANLTATSVTVDAFSTSVLQINQSGNCQ